VSRGAGLGDSKQSGSAEKTGERPVCPQVPRPQVPPPRFPINYLKQRLNGHGGIIVLNALGQFGIAHNTPRMAWACKTVKKEGAGVERGGV
jgi:hypothetical protein